MKYWIIVASKDHVELGTKGSFCQACHGKKWPLKKMNTGDGLLFYSSKKKMGDSRPYQKFTGLGTVRKGDIYRVQMRPGFKPYRRDVEFESCREVAIHPLLDKLDFVENPKRWGYKLMRGFLQINRHDFDLISGQMLSSSSKGIK